MAYPAYRKPGRDDIERVRKGRRVVQACTTAWAIFEAEGHQAAQEYLRKIDWTAIYAKGDRDPYNPGFSNNHRPLTRAVDAVVNESYPAKRLVCDYCDKGLTFHGLFGHEAMSRNYASLMTAAVRWVYFYYPLPELERWLEAVALASTLMSVHTDDGLPVTAGYPIHCLSPGLRTKGATASWEHEVWTYVSQSLLRSSWDVLPLIGRSKAHPAVALCWWLNKKGSFPLLDWTVATGSIIHGMSLVWIDRLVERLNELGCRLILHQAEYGSRPMQFRFDRHGRSSGVGWINGGCSLDGPNNPPLLAMSADPSFGVQTLTAARPRWTLPRGERMGTHWIRWQQDKGYGMSPQSAVDSGPTPSIDAPSGEPLYTITWGPDGWGVE